MRRTLTALTVTAMAMTVACSGSPQPPTTPSTPRTTVTPTTPQVREVAIIGTPANVQIGGTAQLRAVSRADDGGLQDVTQLATWRSTDDTICRVSAGGVVEGRGAGTTTLTASYSGISGTVALTCGFIISALVHENPPSTDVALGGARVEVAGGPLDARTFETDAAGRVTLPPVAAPGFALYFKKRGYDDRRLEVFEFPRHTKMDVWLYREPVTQFDFSGTCGPSPGYRTILFTVPRQGRMRLSVAANGFRAFDWISSSISSDTTIPRGILRVDTSTFPGSMSQAEAIVDPGSYRLYFEGTDCPVASATWRVVLEFPR